LSSHRYIPWSHSVYFYLNDGSQADFFKHESLVAALEKMLVPFYPIAGRFKKEDDSLMEIDYNAAGVLLVEAEAGVRELSDTCEFAPDPRFQQVVLQINYSCDFSSYPLLVLQVRLVCFLHTYSACSSIKQPRFSIWLAAQVFNTV
jgi:shikimate O-hydroxycinnamoyltransferase